MTSKEFVFWMKGFMEACNDYTATPKQWDTIRDKLLEVEDSTDRSFPLNTSSTHTTTTYPYATSISNTQTKQLLD